MSENFSIELWDIGKIIPYEKNAKIHAQEQVEKLAEAIKTFGWNQPIVVDKDGVIIAGHGRRLAAIFLKRAKVPVICRRDLSKVEANALRLADNRVASVEYDMAMIQDELRLIASDADLNFELTAMGFDAKEMDFTLADLGEMDEGFFVEDVNSAVEEQKTNNSQAAAKMDDTAAPVTDALGFKRVSIAESRQIRELMGKVEALTQKTGAEALIEFIASRV